MPLLVGSRRALLGGAGAFCPASLPGLVLSLNAQKLAGFANTDPVASWPDLSGKGNDAAQVTSGKRPLYKTNQINGFPAVVFDNTDDFLVTPTVAMAGATGVTVFCVFSSSAAASRVPIEASANSALVTDAFLMYRHSGGNMRTRAVGDVGATEFSSTSTTVGTASVAAAVICRVDKTLASGETKVTVNGVATGTQTANANNTNGFGDYPLYIGAQTGGTTGFLSGGIGEKNVWNRALSDAEVLQLTAYAKTAWGTP